LNTKNCNYCRIAVIGNGKSFTISIDGEYFTISDSHPHFENAKRALKEKDLESLLSALKPIVIIEKAASALGKVRLEGEKVFCGDKEIRGVIIDRILEFKREGFDFKYLLNFLERLQANPSKTAVDELYLFLEGSSTPLPITEDGCFLAYKKVRRDFKDIHSGTVDYSVGKIVSMARNEVDDERDRTCSYGLHFCSLDYLKNFGTSTDPIVIVKIDPADVVSIPSDYKNTKGRTCKMEVLSVHNKTQAQPAWDKGFISTASVSNFSKSAPAPKETPKAAEYVYFTSRRDARRYGARNWKNVKDFGQNAPVGKRWAVAV